ncbi:MAG: PH domain-containing protein, partial [Chloroflexota bacterium]
GQGTGRDALSLVTAVLFIGGLLFLLWDTLRYLNQEYILTNRRVIQVEGVVNKRATDSSLEKINDAALTQSFFGRIFDFGDLDVLTAAEAGIERFRMIIDPVGFKRAMLDAKHEHEVGMEREGWAPGPPIRDGSGGPAPRPADAAVPGTAPGDRTMSTPSVPMPAPAAPPAPASRSDPDEVTRTLASLADLRDRGAITPEEYETKKADLLGRL